MAAVYGRAIVLASLLVGAPWSVAADDVAIDGKPLKATLPSGVVVELVAVARFPLDTDAWWRPDGTPMPEAPPADLMDEKMIGRRSDDAEKSFSFFIRYQTPDGKQRVLSPRADGDVARAVRRPVGKDPFFSQCVIPMPSAATDGAIRVDVGMDAVETLFRTKTPGESGEAEIPETAGKKLAFRPAVDDHGRYTVTIDCPSEILNNDFIRPVLRIDAKDVVKSVSSQRRADEPAKGTTRLSYTFEAEPARVAEFKLEAFRPLEYAKFGSVCLEPKEPTAPTEEGKPGDRLPKGVKRR